MQRILLTVLAACLCILSASAQTVATQKTVADNVLSNQQAASMGGQEMASPAGLGSINKSGDMSMAVPLTTIRGRSLSLPINLNYQAGIKVEQKSGAVGLGWALPFGSITRDYGAFEPDYTATEGEIDMKNTNGAADGLLSTNSTNASPFDNNRNLLYNKINGNMMPDNYHVNVPGLGSKTFWNKGTPGSSHNFIFNDQAPWDIKHSVKRYEVEQEFSRINEYNLHAVNSSATSPGAFNTGGSFAAAIAVPPYVKQRGFSRHVISSDPPNGSFAPSGSSATVYYEDFKAFTIVAEDGTQYVFGRALRGQKYLFSESPYWSTMQDDGLASGGKAVRGEFWKIDYIAEWLLTEVRSADFIDENSNGIADDADSGDWIRIEYTEAEQDEYVLLGSGNIQRKAPKHREWMNFTQTDRASSLMRERAYVTKIVTPIQEVDFSISPRFDVDCDYFTDCANYRGNFNFNYRNWNYINRPENFDVIYPLELMRYDELVVKERLNDAPFYARERTLRTIKLNYAAQGSAEQLAVSNYLIRNNNNVDRGLYDPVTFNATWSIEDFYTSNGRGKTTLLGVDVFPRNNTGTTDKRSYDFEYAYNPKLNEFKKWDIQRAVFFPNVRQSMNATNSERAVSVIHTPFTDWNGTDHSDPYDVLSTVPYKTEEWTYPFVTLNELATYVDGGSFPANAQLVKSHSGFDPVNGSPVDVLGYFNDPSASGTSKAAWSLTKVTLPAGASIDYEYENDEYDYQADRTKWKIKDSELPIVKTYNDLANERSKRQFAVNAMNGNTTLPSKTLYRSYHLPMDYHGGIRLKKKTITSGGSVPQDITYSYGTGHYTAPPAAYWNSYVSGFSSFISQETHRHSAEGINYHFSVFASVFSQFSGQNEYELKMLPLVPSIRVDNTVNGEHYYESVTENHANGSKITTDYRNPKNKAKKTFRNQKLVAAKLGATFSEDVYIIAQNQAHDRSPRATRTKYIDANGAVYKRIDRTYELVDEVALSFSGQSATPWPADVYVTYGVLATGLNLVTALDPNDNNFPLTNSIDNQSLPFGINSWQNLAGTSQADVYTDLENLKFTHTGYSMPSQSIKHRLSSKVRITKQVTLYEGVETEQEFTYEGTYGLPKTVAITNSSHSQTTGNDNKIITETEYAFENFNISFSAPNMLSQVARTTIYNGAVASGNELSATVNTWQNDGQATVPRRHKDAQYNDELNSQGRIDGFQSYNFQSNVNNKWLLRDHGREFNRYGQQTLSKNNLVYSREVYGYESGFPKAQIMYPDRWFDATYTGFEDHYEDLGNYAVGTAPEEEWWYDQNLSGPVTPASGYIMTWLTGGSVPDLYIDNSNGDFAVGDVITITGNSAMTGNPNMANVTSFTTTISAITQETPGPATNSTVFFPQEAALTDWLQYDWKLTLSAPLPASYPCCFNGAIITRAASDPRISGITSDCARTGTHAYHLAHKLATGDAAQRSPIRPVEIKPWEGDPASKYFHYLGNVWVKRGGTFGAQGSVGQDGGSTYVNSAVNADKALLISMIEDITTDEYLLHDRLVLAMPLSDDVLLALVNRKKTLTKGVLESILVKEERLSDQVLRALIVRNEAVGIQAVETTLLNQPFIAPAIFDLVIEPQVKLPQRTIGQILTHSANYPDAATIINFINTYTLVKESDLERIILAHPGDIPGAVIQAVKDRTPSVSRDLIKRIELAAFRGPLTLVYKLWNADRTSIAIQGSIDITNLSSDWQFYEINIPVVKTNDTQYLDVYVENNLPPYVQGGAVASKKYKIYLDDMLVHPRDAKYSYSSLDQFGNMAWTTDGNDATVRSTFDEWGRLATQFDAEGEQLTAHDYFTTSDISTAPNWRESRTFIDDSHYFIARQYTDGTGKLMQTRISEPQRNRSRLMANEYDNMGWLSKSYNTLGLAGGMPSDDLFTGYASQLETLYNSPHVYSETEYRARPENIPHKTHEPRLTTESDRIMIHTYDGAAAGEVSFGSITYGADELMKQLITDAAGNQSMVYTDKLGRRIAQQVPLGGTYSFDATGHLTWGSGANTAWTYFECDPAGNVIRSIDPKGLETVFTYNSLGQVLTETHPDRGVTENKYDALGRLRFTKDARDAKAITDGLVQDQYSFLIYDEWDRVVRTGKMRTPIGTGATFQNAFYIADRNFPTSGSAGVEDHRTTLFDGSKGNFAVNRELEQRVFSNHTESAGIYTPGTTDLIRYKYTPEGYIAQEYYLYAGLLGAHTLSYEYNRFGLPTRWTYAHNGVTKFTETKIYDDLGRAINASTGEAAGAETLDAHYQYDALGLLRKRSLGYVGTNDWRERLLYRYNIRGGMNGVIGERFRAELSFDVKGNITNQLWSNTQLDNTGGTLPFVQHSYEYFYDPLNRLVGADYSSIQSDNDPFANYSYHATSQVGDFACSTVAAQDALERIQVINGELKDAIKRGTEAEQAAYAVIGLSAHLNERYTDIVNSAFKSGKFSAANAGPAIADLNQLSDLAETDAQAGAATIATLQSILQNPQLTDASRIALIGNEVAAARNVKGVGKGAFYTRITPVDILMKLDTILDDTLHGNNPLAALQGVVNQLSFDIEVSKATVTEIKFQLAKQACKLNGAATAIYNPVLPLTNAVAVTGKKYDGRFYYTKSGNTKTLRRYDDAGAYKHQHYNYSIGGGAQANGNAGVSNQLVAVDINNGVSNNLGTTIGYDYNGNMIKDDRMSLADMAYDMFNLPVSVTKSDGTVISYRYGPSGERTVKKLPGGVSEFFIGPVVVNAAGEAQRFGFADGYAEVSGGTLTKKYTISDWLGTVRLVLDDQGQTVSCRDHYAYGKAMPGRVFESDSEGKRHQFTGHEFDEESGFGYHGARLYNRDYGRYIGVDPLATTTPGWTSYRYAFDNPIMFIDANGMNEDGYEDEDGNLRWDFEHQEESYKDKDGKTWTKVASDYFTFSDLAASKGIKPEYKGKLQLASAEHDDIIAYYHRIQQTLDHQRFGENHGISVTSYVDFSNMQGTPWTSHSGSSWGNNYTREFTVDGKQMKVMFFVQRLQYLQMDHVPMLWSPVTARPPERKEGKLSFPQHRSMPFNFGILLPGTDKGVQRMSSEVNISYLTYKDGKLMQKHWKYVNRKWRKQ